MSSVAQPQANSAPLNLRERRFNDRIRALPIRWRIAAIAALNTAVVLLLAALIWDGARMLSSAWLGLQQARQSERIIVSLESDTARLQNLIHRYFNQPQANLLAEIEKRRNSLLELLKTQAAGEPAFAGSVDGLMQVTERFLAGFDQLRDVHTAIAQVYENEVLHPARDMAGLYGIIEGAAQNRDALIWPSLSKSREAFSAAVVAANAFYLSLAPDAAEDAYQNLTTIERTVPVMVDLAEGDLQRQALQKLGERATSLRNGVSHLAERFTKQSQLLRDAIDGNQAMMADIIGKVSQRVRAHEEQAQAHFDRALSGVYLQVGLVAVAFLALIIAIGIAIAGSISGPLGELKSSMHAIMSGDYERAVLGTQAQDEVGEMARAVEVFRENALARRVAERELRESKEHAEGALADLRDTQKSLIEAEKLAALGSLVAGVAHEVNNPVGISLTVASSLARRSDAFATELKDGQIRKSRLDEFVSGTREASKQLVANLERAGELIQAFKQVAVDRSHEARRQFDLRESTVQIISSLRPGLRRAQIELKLDIPEGIALDSYPGAYGQVLTNLVLNSASHGFADRGGGIITIEAHRSGPKQVEVVFSDDGAGMPEDVQRRAFEPFFTTRRNQGGTGLGLHIVYNIVTRRLGGRILLSSAPNRGTTFRITMALTAPRREASADNDMAFTDIRNG